MDRLLASVLANDKDYHEALEIVRRSTSGGHIWLIGGQVYRRIVQQLYHQPIANNYDFDFIIERPVQTNLFQVPPGWCVTRTGAGGIRLLWDSKQIDIAQLDQSVNPAESDQVSAMNTDDKISSYFRRTPLTVQAVAYDVDSGTLLGDAGKKSIMEQAVTINNLVECQASCRRHNVTVDDYIQQKAGSLGFRVVKQG